MARAILKRSIFSPGVTRVNSLNFTYRYETGYQGSATCGVQFNVTVGGRLAYASPTLADHPYSHSSDPGSYGQAVPVSVDLNIPVATGGIGGGSKPAVELAVYNDCRNIQLLLPLALKLSCSGGGGGGGGACFTAPPPPPPPPAPGAPSCNNVTGVCVHYSDGRDTSAAADMASAADIALIFTGTTSKEGTDRANLNLGADDRLIAAVANASDGVTGQKTVVVVVAPGAVLTDFRDSVGALLIAFMPGPFMPAARVTPV